MLVIIIVTCFLMRNLNNCPKTRKEMENTLRTVRVVILGAEDEEDEQLPFSKKVSNNV